MAHYRDIALRHAFGPGATLAALILCPSAPLAAQDYHFSHAVPADGHVSIANINGAITVLPASGRDLEVSITKKVREGNGDLVKAVLEADGNTVRVCTLYLDSTGESGQSCEHNEHHGNRHERLDVTMTYEVRVPSGVELDVDDVNGDVSVTANAADAHVTDVNGSVTFDGGWASSLETTNGKVIGRFTRGNWDGEMRVENVNGSIDLTFPADFHASVHGETVNGSISSDFPVTIQGKWGPKSFDGHIGTGGGSLHIETVNGGIDLHRR